MRKSRNDGVAEKRREENRGGDKIIGLISMMDL
jgi:hypothetical protein